MVKTNTSCLQITSFDKYLGKETIRMGKGILLNLLLLSTLVLTACTLTKPFATERIVGRLPSDDIPHANVIQAPARVPVDQPFMITVTTYGPDCTSVDGAHVQVDGLVATITPFDRIPTASPCPANLASHPRDLELTFEMVGNATVRVVG
jgi:hypothetical protein